MQAALHHTVASPKNVDHVTPKPGQQQQHHLDRDTEEILNKVLLHHDKEEAKKQKKLEQSMNSTEQAADQSDAISETISMVTEDSLLVHAKEQQKLLSSQRRSDGATEVLMPDPSGGKIMYEILESSVPSNYAVNLEMANMKMDEEQAMRMRDKAFREQKEQDLQEYMNQQTQMYKQKRAKQEQDYQQWVTTIKDMHTTKKQREDNENAQIRNAFQKNNEQLAQDVENALKSKAVDKMQQSQALLAQINEKRAQEKDMHEKKLAEKPQAALLGPKLIDLHNEIKKRKELLEAWNSQCAIKKDSQQQAHNDERDTYNRSINLDLQNLKQEIERSRQQRNKLRDTIKSDWETSIAATQDKAQQQEQAKNVEMGHRLQHEKNLAEERKNQIMTRMEQLRKRKEELDREALIKNALQNTEKAKQREYESAVMKRIAEHLQKKRLYRCPTTRKVLPSDQFNEHVAKNMHMFWE